MHNLHTKGEGSYFENSDVFARKGGTTCLRKMEKGSCARGQGSGVVRARAV